MFHIAVVDDHEDSRRILRVFLEDLYDVSEHESVDAVLAYLETHDCDLVLSDISMPLRDGFDLVEQLRAGKWKDLPIVAITAHVAIRDKILAGGFNTYLTKPVDLEVLLATIRTFLPFQSTADAT
jgi:CheY-like chemotaxis protein